MRGFLKKTTRLLLWGAAVAVLVYFLDPRSGRGRRARTKDQLLARTRRTTRQAQEKVSYAGDRLEGVAHSVIQSDGEAPDDDKTLADKVKSEVLGGSEFEGHQVVVDAVDGVVTLRGELQRPEQINDLEAAVRKVAGVHEVENFVHLPATPAPNKQDSLDA